MASTTIPRWPADCWRRLRRLVPLAHRPRPSPPSADAWPATADTRGSSSPMVTWTRQTGAWEKASHRLQRSPQERAPWRLAGHHPDMASYLGPRQLPSCPAPAAARLPATYSVRNRWDGYRMQGCLDTASHWEGLLGSLLLLLLFLLLRLLVPLSAVPHPRYWHRHRHPFAGPGPGRLGAEQQTQDLPDSQGRGRMDYGTTTLPVPR